MTQSPGQRLRCESAFTVFGLVAVVIILGILLSIAIGAYTSFIDRAEKITAQANIQAAVPAVEVWHADNRGLAADVDGTADTSGYEGMTLELLRSSYSRGIRDIEVPAAGFTLTPNDYCISTTVGEHTYFKRADDIMREVTGSTPLCS